MEPQKKEEIKCPQCGSSQIIPVHYGKPCDENIKKAERGEIILAGCRRPNNPPKYACKKCKKRI